MDELAIQFQVAATSIERSRESLGIIAERSESIVSSSERLNPILKALDTDLKAFSALADNARTAFPIIEDRLNKLTKDFSTAVQTTINNSHASMDKQQQALQDSTGRIFQKVEDRITAQFASFARLDTELQEELTKALESLGSQLCSLSEKFVDDYTPLTEKLQKVVQMADSH